jgi:hypothetical protein
MKCMSSGFTPDKARYNTSAKSNIFSVHYKKVSIPFHASTLH